MRVLVIDDDALGAESLCELLRNRGCRTQWAVNADGGLARMTLAAFDAVICDEYMPGIDGLGLVRRMRHHDSYRCVPAVILTAASDDAFFAIEAELRGLQPACALRKPAGVGEVLAALDSLFIVRPVEEREMAEHHDETKRELHDAGIPEQQHDAVRDLRPLAQAKGIDWHELVAIVSDYGPIALVIMRRTIEAMRGRLTPPEGQEKI